MRRDGLMVVQCLCSECWKSLYILSLALYHVCSGATGVPNKFQGLGKQRRSAPPKAEL